MARASRLLAPTRLMLALLASGIVRLANRRVPAIQMANRPAPACDNRSSLLSIRHRRRAHPNLAPPCPSAPVRNNQARPLTLRHESSRLSLVQSALCSGDGNLGKSGAAPRPGHGRALTCCRAACGQMNRGASALSTTVGCCAAWPPDLAQLPGPHAGNHYKSKPANVLDRPPAKANACGLKRRHRIRHAGSAHTNGSGPLPGRQVGSDR